MVLSLLVWLGAGKIVQWLRALVGNPSPICKTHMVVHKTNHQSVTPISEALFPSSGLHGYCIHVVHIQDTLLP